MQNIIAVIWDFDKTLIDGNMQDPIFEEYHIDKAKFWQHVNALPAYYAKEGVKVNADTIYLNQFIKDAQNGIFKGLNNEKLKTFGQKQKYYHGVPEIFKNLQRVVEENPKYREYNIKVEHYIVSTGMSAIIKGSSVMPYVEDIWGCDLIEGLDAEKHKIISEVGYTIDNTTKTREDGRIDMYAEADYREGTTAYMWLTHKVNEIAERIYKTEKESLEGAVSAAPRHLV
nr:haloacid dehalogenase-like hydrolase [uncultured Megasphaera sp.]